MAAGNLPVAVSKFRLAAKADPQDLDIQFNLGLALLKSGSLIDAVAPLRRSSTDPLLSGESHFLLGAAYFQSRQYTQAIRELRDLLNSKHEEQVLYMLEESARLSGDVTEARDAFQQLNRRFPDSAWNHYLMATAYESGKAPDKAIAEYQKALSLDQTVPNANFAVGYLYFRLGDMEQAGQWLQKEAAKGCHSLANLYLGEIARSEKDLRQAETLYRKALKCDATNAEAHLRLGYVLADTDRNGQAMAELRAAIRLKPKVAGGHYRLASVYRKLGRTADAEAELTELRAIQKETDTGLDVTRDAKP